MAEQAIVDLYPVYRNNQLEDYSMLINNQVRFSAQESTLPPFRLAQGVESKSSGKGTPHKAVSSGDLRSLYKHKQSSADTFKKTNQEQKEELLEPDDTFAPLERVSSRSR